MKSFFNFIVFCEILFSWLDKNLATDLLNAYCSLITAPQSVQLCHYLSVLVGGSIIN